MKYWNFNRPVLIINNPMKFYKPESFSAGCKRCRTKAASSPSLSRSCLVLRTFSDTFSSLRPDKPWVTKLSSAGLVYVHFGRQLLAQLTQLKEGDRQLEVLYDKVRISLRSPSPPSAKVDFKGRTRGENSSFSSAGFKDRNHAAALRWKNAERSCSFPGRPCEDSWQWRGWFEMK